MKDTVIIFDLDGTILDTNELVIDSFKTTFAHFDPSLDLSMDVLLSMLGPTLEDSFGRYLPSHLIDDAISYYRQYNKAMHAKLAHLYDGEEQALKQLQDMDYPLVVLTTKRQDMAEYGLQLFGIDHYFTEVIGMERLTKMKPDPEGVNMAMALTNTRHAVMIGDNASDIMAGINANQQAIGVGWSLKYDDLKAMAIPIVSSLDELVSVIVNM